jgi:hypothetical protein
MPAIFTGMSLKVKASDAVPGGFVGGVATAVLVVMLQNFVNSAAAASQAGGAQPQLPDPVAVSLLILAIFAAGGFIAGFVATRGRKGAFAESIAAAVVSGASSVGILALVLLATTPQLLASGAQAFLVQQQLGVVIILIAAFSIAVSAIGGVIVAFIQGGARESALWKVFSSSARFLVANPVVFLPPLVFTALVTIIGILAASAPSDDNLLLAAAAAVVVASVVLTAMALSSVILAASRRLRSVDEVFRASTEKAKDVSLALVAVAIPPVIAIVGVSMLPSLGQALFNPVASLAFFALEIALLLYLLAVSFTPQAASLGKDGVVAAVKSSVSLVRHNFFGAAAFYALLLIIIALFEVAVFIVETLVAMAGVDASAVTGALSGAATLAFAATAQTAFFQGGRK